ncbi:MAG: Gfo/Idh/MocA family oxidoreductase [Desulfovibrionaceae bacterium]
MIGVGVIGLGVGRHHARGALAHPGVDRVLLCDLDRKRAETLALELRAEFPDKAVNVADAAQHVLDAPDMDAVSVCSYDDAHFSQVLRALTNAKHVYAEKPLCQTPEQAAEIRAALERANANQDAPLRFSANMVLRTCPLFREVRQELRSGEFGRVFSMDADYLWGRPEKLTTGWRGRMESYSIIQGASVHMVDLLLWLTGERPVEVHAWGNNLATSEAGFPFPDFSALSLRFESGMVARVAAYGGCVHPHFHRLAVFGTKRTFLHGLEGGVYLDSPEAAPRPAQGVYPAREERVRAQHAFLDAVCGQGKALISETDIFNVMSVCFAADESMRTGGPVRVRCYQ